MRLPCAKGDAQIDITKYHNQSGFSSDAMKDFQRVFACLDMSDLDNSGLDASEEKQKYWAKVASVSDFGARVTVPMTAQAEWRLEWERVRLSSLCRDIMIFMLSSCQSCHLLFGDHFGQSVDLEC